MSEMELDDLIGAPDKRGITKRERMVQKVSDLMQRGLTQQEIADRLDITQGYVSQLQKDVRQVWRDNMSQSYDDYVAQEAEHYRILLKALEHGIEAGSWKHVETAIKLAERRSRLIGMDHSDRMEEARVRIEAAQLDLMTRAINVALTAIGATEPQKAVAVEALLLELEGGDE